MFKKRNDPTVSDLITAVTAEMAMYGPEADEYPALLEKLERLTKVQTKSRRPRVTPDGVIQGVANLAVVAVIVLVERNGVFTSKAQQMLSRPK